MKPKRYFLYSYILKCYQIDINYIYTISYLSTKYTIQKELLEKMLDDFKQKDFIVYINRKKCFKITFQGYLYIEKSIREEISNLLTILSIFTSILVSIFAFVRS